MGWEYEKDAIDGPLAVDGEVEIYVMNTVL
jgi:hypothetical protein